MKPQSKNETEVLGLITKIQEQLIALNKKVDVLMMRALVGSSNMPANQKPVEKPEHHKEKVMYPAICADCNKECSLPFKPSGDRPVYCKDCFALRRSGNLVQVTPPVQVKEAARPVKGKKEESRSQKSRNKEKTGPKEKIICQVFLIRSK